MRLADFKARVIQAFGERLEHATPANVREFLDELQKENWQTERAEQSQREGRINPPLDLSADTETVTWESLVREFFLQALETEPEQALIMLWLFGIDLAYSGIEEMQSDTMERLFRDRTT